jgi:CBS domain-containing protein
MNSIIERDPEIHHSASAASSKPDDVTAAKLMSSVTTIRSNMSLESAARVLNEAAVSWAPVVDDLGRCVGIISAVDLLRWAENDIRGKRFSLRNCPYQMSGRLMTGKDAILCSLAEGECPFQSMEPMTGGRHVAVCLMPHEPPSDSQQSQRRPLRDEVVGEHMTKRVVTVASRDGVDDLARKMADGQANRAIVTDERGKPLGIISAKNVLMALANSRSSSLRAANCEKQGGSPASQLRR